MIYNLEIALDELLLKGKMEEKMDVAKNLLLLRVNVDTIAKATGLTVEEIEALGGQLQ